MLEICALPVSLKLNMRFFLKKKWWIFTYILVLKWIVFFLFRSVVRNGYWVMHENAQTDRRKLLCVLYFVGHCRGPFYVIVWKQLKMIFISLAFEWVVYGQINICKCEQVNLRKVWNETIFSLNFCLSCASVRAIIKLAWGIVLVRRQQQQQK